MSTDIVVVGGGAAGCVVAARLAEKTDASVLLLEAGPDLRADPPADLHEGWHITKAFDWGYASTPGQDGSTQPVRRVKALGGTSWVTRFALRGSPGDYDEWGALGVEGWSFDDVLPWLRRVETDLDFGHEPWHGDAGPMPVSRYLDLERTPIHAAALEAFAAVGFRAVDDHNRPGAVGFGPMPMSSRDGERVTPADAYLPLGATPANLTIRPESQVADLVIDGARATGVRLLDGTRIEARLVVLCAGTYGSPSILLHSGIGPANDLVSIGVPVRVDLPGVGANLSDHPGIDGEGGFRGPMRDAPLLRSVATFHSQDAATDGPPDLMLWISDPLPITPSFSIDVALLKPRSRGRVRLGSADPADPPLIELPSLQDPHDVDRLVEGYRRAYEVAARPEVQRLCEDRLPPEVTDNAELRRLVRREAYSLPHVVGTCAMGSSPDHGAVVDRHGRVFGIDGLHVVDASIMPTVPSGFTHIPTIMLAERLAERLADEIAGASHE